MALIGFGDPDALPKEARAIWDDDPRKMNMVKLWINATGMYLPMVKFLHATQQRQKLDPAYRELTIMAIARLDGGCYPWTQHIRHALTAGLTKEQIDALRRVDFDAACFDAKAKTLLSFVRALRNDVQASEEEVLKTKGFFSDQELVEIIVTAGFYMTMSRLSETARVEIDPPPGYEAERFARVPR